MVPEIVILSPPKRFTPVLGLTPVMVHKIVFAVKPAAFGTTPRTDVRMGR